MKKFWKSLMFALVGVFALSSCEDVPAPYDIPGAGSENTPIVDVAPEGDGTLESPYNVAACLELIDAMEADVESAQAYYIKGKVAANSTTEATISQYGNMTFTMYDEGNPKKTFTAFQVYGPGNKKFTSVDQIKVGDEVVVYGKVVNYRGNTPETVGKGQAYVYSINESSDTPETPGGIEVTCAEAVEITKALEDNATSADTYTVTGYITEVVGNVSRNQQTFWMADTKDGGKVFEAYYANLPEGVSEFKAGSKVKITGQLTKYVGNNGQVTAEIKNANVEILEDGGGNPPVEGTEVTCAEAASLTNALADGATSTETYTITGYITEVVGSVSRNQQTFWMADTKDGGKVFEAYYANLPEGVSEFKAGMKVKITGQLTKYVNNSGQVTPEIKNANVVILEDGGGNPPVEGTDVTCAEAASLTNALADGATSAETYTVTGYITEVVGSVSRNQQTFWMADTKDGGKVFEAYYANLPEGVSEFKAGMKVKITGQLLKYVNNSGQVTPEIKNANVEILEDGGGNPPVEGTDVTCAEAASLTNALADGATSAETYTVTGYITEVVGSVSRNQQTFWMADTKDGGKVFEAYYANLPEGVSAFKAGMKVKITGQLLKYVNNSGQVTPEIKNADVVILEGGDGGDTPGTTPEGDVTIAASAMGLTNNTSWTTVTVNGVTFTADGGGNQNTPKYFDNGSNLRMYPKNSLTISAGKNIASIVLTCTKGSVANGNVGVDPGSVNVADPTITISDINSKTVKITNNDGSTGAASQIRIESIAITFAE